MTRVVTFAGDGQRRVTNSMMPRRKTLSPLPVGIAALLFPLAAAYATDRSCESLAQLKIRIDPQCLLKQ